MALFTIPGVDPSIQGRWINLSLQRRLMCDMLHFAQRVPSVPSQRRMHLADVIEARARGANRVSWCAIFMKAFAVVAAARPELRRCYLPWLWPHLYEHPINVASFAVEREYRCEPGVFFATIARPEECSLRHLDSVVRRHQTDPVESMPAFARSLRLCRFPLPIRRIVWWLGLYTDGARRGHFFGTFGVSLVGALGASGLHIRSPLTTTLNYGTFEPDGSLDVRITYDHRVVDGAQVARALAELEEVLCGEIRRELLVLAAEEEHADAESAATEAVLLAPGAE